MADDNEVLRCTLYIFPFSLYSIMARFTAALGASTVPGTRAIIIEPRLVNLHRNESIAERYLLELNPKGQVRR